MPSMSITLRFDWSYLSYFILFIPLRIQKNCPTSSENVSRKIKRDYSTTKKSQI